MLVLLQHSLVVLTIARVMGKEVVENAQRKADNTYGQEAHPPPLNAKGGVPTCRMHTQSQVMSQ